MELASLVRMANDQHITDFWDPRMKAAILGSDRAGLSPIAAAAIERIGGEPMAPPAWR